MPRRAPMTASSPWTQIMATAAAAMNPGSVVSGATIAMTTRAALLASAYSAGTCPVPFLARRPATAKPRLTNELTMVTAEQSQAASVIRLA